MGRALGFLFWLVAVLGLYGGIHYYFWTRLVRASALPHPWHLVFTGLIVLLAITLPLAFVLVRFSGPEGGDLLLWPAFYWAGLALYLLLILLSADLVRGIAWVVIELQGSSWLYEPGHRLLLDRGVAAGALLLAALLSGTAFYTAQAGPTVKRVTVPLKRLPAELSGTTIALLSDLHAGRTIGRPFVEKVARQIQQLEPDLIAITGDLVDGSVERLHNVVAPIAALEAPLGVYFVTGNHESYSGVQPWVAWIEQQGIQVLRNERVSIGEGAASFDLAGVDDSFAFGRRDRPHGHGADMARALSGRDLDREVILLAHQPREIHAAAQHGVGLQLSGHTHGGQLWPFVHMARIIAPYVSGLHRHGDTWIYVTRGAGSVGPPMRLGAPPEIALIELVRASETTGVGDGGS